MGNCYLGPSIPAWLKSQKKLKDLDFSNASISVKSNDLSMFFYYKQSLVVNIKGLDRKYTTLLFLLTSIDLSGNNLHGYLPRELMKLAGLIILNLNRNHISCQIPESISNLQQLSSLDLSSNNLFGPIPPSMLALDS
ncbi:hypothetical protein CMV_017282 [Castanea mollissima]|uniref:Uncharacterized protein n=1 Tax=Castanea mollissima TaxID=60419 RepID=A0A8J4VIQ0_9ROSI|nr:hypothetical protein CMV_017282 [Castanea mollissima]